MIIRVLVFGWLRSSSQHPKLWIPCALSCLYVVKNLRQLDHADPTARYPPLVRGKLQKKTLQFVYYYISHPERSLRYSNSVRFAFTKPPRFKIFHYQENEIPISWLFCKKTLAFTFVGTPRYSAVARSPFLPPSSFLSGSLQFIGTPRRACGAPHDALHYHTSSSLADGEQLRLLLYPSIHFLCNLVPRRSPSVLPVTSMRISRHHAALPYAPIPRRQ